MVSVITPAYMAEKYIKRCIESVKRQIYQEYEHIIVIQGNKDKTKEICEHYSLNDNKIRLFYVEENSNLCINRNIGIRNSLGDWIAFLDADDEFEPFFLSNLINNPAKNSADIMMGLIVRKGIDWINKQEPYELCDTQTISDTLLNEKNVLPFYIGIYKKDIFRYVSFDENISVMEDWLFMKEALLHSRNICFVNSHGYIYWFNGENSLAWNKEYNYAKHINKAHCNIYSHLKYYDELKDKGVDGQNILLSAFNIFFVYFLYSYIRKENFNKIDLFKESKILSKYLREIKGFKRFRYLFFIRHPFISFKVFIFLRKFRLV